MAIDASAFYAAITPTQTNQPPGAQGSAPLPIRFMPHDRISRHDDAVRALHISRNSAGGVARLTAGVVADCPWLVCDARLKHE